MKSLTAEAAEPDAEAVTIDPEASTVSTLAEVTTLLSEVKRVKPVYSAMLRTCPEVQLV